MITEKDLQISNKSYTNKDFASIYQEVLDLAKKLSNRFDPETSNESDPFIVLIKLLSFIGDKINYNIDKNILERFMPSATQESSMRNLCEMMGYNMHYYIAPETTITIQYVGKEELSESHSFTIPKYTYVSNSNTEDENKVNFFIKNRDITVDSNNIVYGTTNEPNFYIHGGNIVVIEGEIKQLTILGDDIIHLDNLDDNNRVYFPERMVAENGIFIEGGINKGIENEWIKIDNLNIRDNLFVYKFGYDSLKGLPYIEFPDNISALIGDGLKIKYTVTSGLSGNINAKVLNCLNISELPYNDNPDSVINVGEKEDGIYPLNIINVNAALNGRNPESINEAYNGFKKTIGTFDTLVTCRDYMNYIYNLLDDDEIFSLVSNIMVSDRRTDINYSTPIVTYGEGGQTTITNIEQGSNGDKLTAYDLCLYPLQSYKQDNLDNYKNSFTPEYNQTHIRQKIEDSRCISHDYKNLENDDIYLIKNYLKLTCRIGTTYKVNASEQAKIVENIQKALAHDYNARNVDYGYEIPYDSLVKTIENADARIKSVTLYEPDLTTKIKIYDSTKEEITIGSDATGYFNTIIAKNILAGRYQLFDYNTEFNYEYGQQKINSMDMIYENIESVDTVANLVVNTTEKLIKANQQIQIIWPSLITDTIYPYGQNYAADFTCGADEIHSLSSNQHIAFFWTDTEKKQRYVLFQEGDIIKPSFAIQNTADSGSTANYYLNPSIIASGDSTVLEALGYDSGATPKNIYVRAFPSAQDTVEKLSINKETIDTTCYCYWSLNNTTNSIFSTAEELEYILDTGEYFYKTDPSFNTLAIYGAGTKIKRTANLNGFDSADQIDLSEISETGILGNKNLFHQINCTDSLTLEFLENSILTLNEEDKYKYGSGSTSLALNNTFVELTDAINFRYQLKDSNSWEPLDSINITDVKYQIRSRLNINSGPNLGQIINAEDSFTFKFKNVKPKYLNDLTKTADLNKISYTISEDGLLNTNASGTSGTLSVSKGDIVKFNWTSDTDWTWQKTNTNLVLNGNTLVNKYFKLNSLRQVSGGINTNLAEINYLVDKDASDRYKLVNLYLYGLSANYETYQPDYNGYVYTQLNNTITNKDFDIPNVNKETLIMIWTNETGNTDSDIKITYSGGTIKDYSTDSTISTENKLKRGINILSITGLATFKLINNSSASPKPEINIILSNLSVINGFNPEIGNTKAAAVLAKIRNLDNNKQFLYNYIPDTSKFTNETDLLSPYAFYDYNNLYNKWTMSEIDFENSIIEIARGSRV